MSETHPLHPVVATLLEAFAFVKDGETRVPKVAMERAEKDLRGLEEPDEAFFDLLAAWHKLHEARIQPAANQLMILVKIFPQVQDMQNAQDLARFASQSLQDNRKRGTAGAFEAPKGLGVKTRPTKRG